MHRVLYTEYSWGLWIFYYNTGHCLWPLC